MIKTRKHYEWLNDYLELDEEIKLTEWRIRKAEREEARWTDGDLSHLHLAKKSKGSHVMDSVPAMRRRVAECKAQQAEALELIDTFKDYTQKMLKMKYIDGMTLEEIAEKLGYSAETIRQKHAEARRMLDFLDDYDNRRHKFRNRLDWIEPEEE